MNYMTHLFNLILNTMIIFFILTFKLILIRIPAIIRFVYFFPTINYILLENVVVIIYIRSF